MKKEKLKVLVWVMIGIVAAIGAFITYLIFAKVLACVAAFSTIVGVGVSVYAFFIEKSSMGNLAGAFVAIAGLIGIFISVKDSNNKPFNATIKVYGWEGYDHNPLNGKGTITLEFNKPETVGINEKGIAVFTDIPPKYNGKIVAAHITEPYYLTDSVIRIEKDGTISIQVLLRGLEKLDGTIYDNISGEGLPDVSVTLAGIPATTDEKGFFSIEIPIEKQRQEQKIIISKQGYESKQETVSMTGEYNTVLKQK